MFRTPTGYQARENEVRAGSVLTPPQKRIFWSNISSRSKPQPLPCTGQVRSGQVRSGQVRSGQVRSGQVRSGQVRSGQDRSGQARSGQVRSGQVRSGQVRSGQVRSGKGMWFRLCLRSYLFCCACSLLMILLGPGRLVLRRWRKHWEVSRLIPGSKAKCCIVKLVAAM